MAGCRPCLGSGTRKPVLLSHVFVSTFMLDETAARCGGPVVCMGRMRTCIHFASRCIHRLRLVHHEAPLQHAGLLHRCSFHTDPNTCFPRPENLRSAHQTDKYLIGLPRGPSPTPGSLSGHERHHAISAPCHSLGIKAHVGTKSGPAHLRTPLRLVPEAPVCLARSAAQMPGQNR